MKRKIIQISTYYNPAQRWEQGVITALADDGTLWRGWQWDKKDFNSFKWTQVNSLPDDNTNLGKVREHGHITL